MGKFIDLTGMIFGNWTVIKRVENNSKNETMWLCQCNCEEKITKPVKGKTLTKGTSRSCGCLGSNAPLKLTGMVFGRWKVIARVENTNSGKTLWLCECLCIDKTRKQITGERLTSGKSQSCGCIRKERIETKNTKHGYKKRGTKLPEYNCWMNMKSRCYDKLNQNYDDYGGRGIEVCERWLASFENFIEDMGFKPTELYSLDRINVNGNYEPSNCRWADSSTQAINKRVTNKLGVTGVAFNKKTNRYRACITVRKNRIWLGSFVTFEEAKKARKNAELKYWGLSEDENT